MIPVLDLNYFKYSGRIITSNGTAYIGHTNSSVEFYVKGKDNTPLTISATISTKLNGEQCEARLKVFLDDNTEASHIIILNQETYDYPIALFDDDDIHKIKIIKITEASMSYAALHQVNVIGGDILLLPNYTENEIKVEFIGDSITCGYGVHGEPNSEFHIKEEDGLFTYASFTSQELNLNARYFCVSGYGVYLSYDENPEHIISKVYPYTNYFINEELIYDNSDFIPQLYVINLGTNDSNHLSKKENQIGFVHNYIELLKMLKKISPTCKIICTCGTVCTSVFPLIASAVEETLSQGYDSIYTLEFPFHNVKEDGIASGHPSIKTHKKDSLLLISKIKEVMKL